jgi:hypothetical protein
MMSSAPMHSNDLGLRGLFVLVFDKNTTVVVGELVDLFFCRILRGVGVKWR